VAQINARTQGEYIRQIISVADPRFRDALKKAAWEELRVRV
jgi:acyl-CoA hydrolase